MADRGQESPMDFQWEGTGPIDPNSPFRTVVFGNTLINTQNKHSHPTFESPSKPSLFSTPTPNPSSQFKLFTTPSKTPAATPFKTPFRTTSFTTPRTAFDTPSKDSDLHSETDDARSPEPPESEAPTPEPPQSYLPSSPSKQLLAMCAITPNRVTGRGELRRGKYHDGAITKIRRRRQKIYERDLYNVITDDDDEECTDNDEDGDPPARDYAPPRRFKGVKNRAQEWVQAHRDIPVIASHYIQFFFNLSLLLLLLYALFCFYITIRQDVDRKVEEEAGKIAIHMAMCSKNYVENRCAPQIRVPAMEEACARWEECMNRDPVKIGRARVSVQTFAEIINSFVEPISYKTMFFTLILIFGGVFISNFAFVFFRAKHINHPQPFMAGAAPPMPPQWDPQSQYDAARWNNVHLTPRTSTPVPMTPSRSRSMPMEFRTPGTSRKAVGWR